MVRYDSQLLIKLVTDASIVGVEAVLMQVCAGDIERPVVYASRILTQTEQKYPIVEKEGVAVSYGIGEFHQYFYGRIFSVLWCMFLVPSTRDVTYFTPNACYSLPLLFDSHQKFVTLPTFSLYLITLYYKRFCFIKHLHHHRPL